MKKCNRTEHSEYKKHLVCYEKDHHTNIHNEENMKILITNDDGIQASGIHRLAKALHPEHDVYMYAPSDEKSGVGHSFTFLQPLRVVPVSREYKAYAINGTPVDCVKLGMYHMGETPDFIVSGINRGANLGTDVLYSGTASAAMEGVLLGVPSLAVSCAGTTEPMHYETAAHFAKKALRYMMENPLPPFTMLNLNVPDKPLEEVKGLRACRLGFRNYSNGYKRCTDPRGNEYYWLDDEDNPSPDETCDIEWSARGYATVSPVSPDMTAYLYLDAMRQHPLNGFK